MKIWKIVLILALPAPMLGESLSWPPKLPGGKVVDSGTSPKLLQPGPNLKSDV